MKEFFSKITIGIAIALCAGQASANVSANDLRASVRGNNEFGLAVFKDLVLSKDNVLYSPVSMNAALSMVAVVSDNSSQTAFINAMGIQGLSPENYGFAWKDLITRLSKQSPEYKVNLANSMWLTKELAVNQSSNVKALKEIYGAKVENSFSFEETGTATAMNSWVEKQTQGMIKELVTDSEVAPLHWATINAIHFDGKWPTKFGGGDQNYKGEFKTSKGEISEATYMEVSTYDGPQYFREKDTNIIYLPYGKAASSSTPLEVKGAMLIVQPNNPWDLKKVVAGMTDSKITDFLNTAKTAEENGQYGNYAIQLPAFQLDSETGMKEIQSELSSNGAGQFFEAFDMSALNPALNVQLKNRIKLIKQKASITLANEGTLAAAASFVGGGIESMGPETVYVDSAFAYFIVDEATGLILFAGTIDTMKNVITPKMK